MIETKLTRESFHVFQANAATPSSKVNRCLPF